MNGTKIEKPMLEVLDPTPEVFDENSLGFLAPGLAFMRYAGRWPHILRTRGMPGVTFQSYGVHNEVTCAILPGNCPSRALVQHGKLDLVEMTLQHEDCVMTESTTEGMVQRQDYVDRIVLTGRPRDDLPETWPHALQWAACLSAIDDSRTRADDPQLPIMSLPQSSVHEFYREHVFRMFTQRDGVPLWAGVGQAQDRRYAASGSNDRGYAELCYRYRRAGLDDPEPKITYMHAAHGSCRLEFEPGRGYALRTVATHALCSDQSFFDFPLLELQVAVFLLGMVSTLSIVGFQNFSLETSLIGMITLISIGE